MGKLKSEKVVISSPLSFSGSAKRIWKITDVDSPAAVSYTHLVASKSEGFDFEKFLKEYRTKCRGHQ